MVTGDPAAACPSPGDPGGAEVGRAKFRDDLAGEQRLEVRGDAPDAAGGTFEVSGNADFSGPGLPAMITLDDTGQGGLRLATEPGGPQFKADLAGDPELVVRVRWRPRGRHDRHDARGVLT